MENFVAYNPTKLHFGKDVIEDLGNTMNEFGKRVLFMFGKGSIQKNGIYDAVMKQLEGIGAEVIEYSGIKSNPVVEDVIRAAELGKLNGVDVILGVGGGSVIDSAKMTGLAIANSTDPWAIMKGRVKPKSTIPLVAVLTIAATGTEMNGAAVLQNHKTEEKIGYVSRLNYPKHSFLDPSYTQSVSKDYTAYGIVDLIAHSFESYFGGGECSLSDRFVESIVKEAMESGPKVLKEPDNYEYRANIMWSATNALNGMLDYGRAGGDWGVHDIGHNISYLYNTPHGATLSIAYIAWLKLQSDRIPGRIKKLGRQLFNVDSVDKTIEKLEEFFKSIGSPVRLSEIGIEKDQQERITNQMLKTEASGYVHQLSDDDRKRVVELMM